MSQGRARDHLSEYSGSDHSWANRSAAEERLGKSLAAVVYRRTLLSSLTRCIVCRLCCETTMFNTRFPLSTPRFRRPLSPTASFCNKRNVMSNKCGRLSRWRKGHPGGKKETRRRAGRGLTGRPSADHLPHK